MDLTSPKKTSPKNIRKNLPRKPRRLGGFQDLLETVAVLENGIPQQQLLQLRRDLGDSADLLLSKFKG